MTNLTSYKNRDRIVITIKFAGYGEELLLGGAVFDF